MELHVVRPGETVSSIARQYGVGPEILIRYNGLTPPYALAAGQCLAVFFPTQTATAAEGDTLFSLGQRYGVTPMELLRRNPQLGGSVDLTPGQTLVISLERSGSRRLELSGYAYPFTDPAVIRPILPYASYLIPFTHGVAADGGVVVPEDETLLRLARQYGARPLLHLSTLTEDGRFSSERATDLLADPRLQSLLSEAVTARIREAGYEGLDVDFEFLGRENAAPYAAFLEDLRRELNGMDMELFCALAPKTSAAQPGVLYEGHDYAALGQICDAVLLMTYEWGYAYSEPMAVSPLPAVRRVLDYAVTEIPPEKIFLGFSNYGYDWPLPYVRGQTRATSISNAYAVELAVRYGAEIRYDETAQSPFFRYTDENGVAHEVWFEDARSCTARFALPQEYGFRGVGYWNFSRPFPVSFALLDDRYDLVKFP